MSSPCPVCQNVMMKPVRDSRSGLVLELCPRCRGWWFDGGEAAKLAKAPGFREEVLQFDSAPAGAPPASGERIVMMCSKCTTVMHTRNFGELTVDVCQRCKSLWFDSGEVSRMLCDENLALTDLLAQRDLTLQAKWEDDFAEVLGAVAVFFRGWRRSVWSDGDSYF